MNKKPGNRPKNSISRRQNELKKQYQHVLLLDELSMNTKCIIHSERVGESNSSQNIGAINDPATTRSNEDKTLNLTINSGELDKDPLAGPLLLLR